MKATEISTLTAVNGLPFGASTGDVVLTLGEPDDALQNYTGELELLYGDSIYRTLNDKLVEVTVPDDRRCVIDGVEVLSVYDWLGALEGTEDIAKFRISRSNGIAYDNRNPAHGSITIFEEGRWDGLLNAHVE